MSKKWFRVRETHGVEIKPGRVDALILAVTVCIDALTLYSGAPPRPSIIELTT